jgi:hypothetical protein
VSQSHRGAFDPGLFQEEGTVHIFDFQDDHRIVWSPWSQHLQDSFKRAGSTPAVEFRQSNFAGTSDLVTNKYLPLTPGKQFIYEGFADRGGGLTDHQVIFTVTDLVRIIDGVETVVVWDRDINRGVLQEAELAFFAQDKDGNVWNLGEYPEEYEDGKFIGAPSTWISGEKDAQGGIHMLANPQPSARSYLQGIVPSIEFHDIAKVLRTNEKVSVDGQSYKNVLVTEEWDPQALPAKQHKFHAPNVGIVQITPVRDPEAETLKLTELKQLSEGEMVFARQAALRLEERAYNISDVYREADPAGRFHSWVYAADITGGSGWAYAADFPGGSGDEIFVADGGSDHLRGITSVLDWDFGI